jgi:hypothetical protein
MILLRSRAHLGGAVHFTGWVEQTPLSVWVREADTLLAFPTVLFLHTLGLALLVGPTAMLSLRLLGFAKTIEVAPFERFMPLVWAGFWLNAASGLLLLIGYPTKALTNPVFFLKLACVFAAVAVVHYLARALFERGADPASPEVRRMAGAVLALWAIAIAAGRLLAYTFIRLMADFSGR